MVIWLVLGLIVLLALVAVVMNMKRGKEPTDYYTLFIIGIVWLPFGIVMKFLDGNLFVGNLFILLGLIYSLMGLANRDKWKKNRKSWEGVKGKDKRMRAMISIGLGIALLVGLVIFYLFSKV